MDQRPWLSQYPAGIPANVDVNQYPTINSFLEECFQKYSNRIAFSCMGAHITYKELSVQSRQFGAYLHSRGLKPGDRIALMMPNLIQYPIALFGALQAGLVVVNTNPLYTATEMKHQFQDSKVNSIIIAENFADKLESILKETGIEVIITTSIGEMLGAVKGTVVNFVVRNIKKMVPKYHLPNAVTISQAVKEGKRFTINSFEDHPDRVVVHQYTGGTTGVAKGAMLTNKNLVANMLQIKAWIGSYIKEGEVTLSPLPMYHIFAFTVNCMAMLGNGAKTVLITNPRDLKTVVDAFKKDDITLMTGINTLFKALLNNESFRALDFSKLKVVVGGGMAVQTSVAEEWKRVTGVTLSEGYGMTESSPVATVNPIDGSARLGSIGLPVPSTDIRVVDEQGSPLAAGEIGELQIKGPQVMAGYYNQPEETAKVLKDGWLSTGDMAFMEPDGYFRIVDRKKDMILVSGFNVYPNEIEDVIAAHPKVMECCAIGIPNEKSGEVVKLFVVKKDKSLTEAEVLEYAREHMTNYKIPKEIVFLDELPKSNVGKILRKELR